MNVLRFGFFFGIFQKPPNYRDSANNFICETLNLLLTIKIKLEKYKFTCVIQTGCTNEEILG